MKSSIGFIGLGIMGTPMCRHLLAQGLNVIVNDINPEAVKRAVSKGAKSASLKELAQECEIIFTILPDGEVVEDVIFGENGLVNFLAKGTLVVDMSSVEPSRSISMSKRLSKIDVAFLDAPVSGGEPKAIEGTLAFMVGGSENDFMRACPYFEIMGSVATLVGPAGTGSVTKLANQIIVNLNIAAMSEALVFVTAAGANPQKVYEAIRGGLAGSTVLDAKALKVIDRNFEPGATISINHKDLNNVLSLSHNLGIPMPFTAQLYEIMQYLKISGSFEEDHCAIVKYFEEFAQTKVDCKDN